MSTKRRVIEVDEESYDVIEQIMGRMALREKPIEETP